jgi:hypothetical protein
MLAQNDANTANWAHDTKIKQHGVTGMHARGTIEKPAFYTASTTKLTGAERRRG